MPANPNRIEVYMPPADRERLVRVAAKLERQGEQVRDGRGNISLSKAIRVLVDREAARP
jgi:hypothetical protein